MPKSKPIKKKIKISLFKKFLIRFAPKMFFRYMAEEQGIGSKRIDSAMDLFKGVKRIDIHPLSGGSSRGFIITLDRKLSLYFYQNGDSFNYDGFEMGEYDKGDVTIFNKLDL